MPDTRIRIGSLPRGAPRSDQDEGLHLRDLLLDALSRGAAPLVAVVLRQQRIDLIETDVAARTRIPLDQLLAGLTRSEAPEGGEVDAVGLMGVVRGSGAADPPVSRMALVFLEWADCRWWSWRAAIGPDGRSVLDDTSTIRCAERGDRLPDGLGRWWSLGRRARMRVRLRPTLDEGLPLETSDLVH